MWSQDKRWLLAFNGELYNNESLRASMHGRTYRGEADTETLVELLAGVGIHETLSRINGMFAFVALDTRSGNLYAARDGVGIKPLYVYSGPDYIGFASEIRAFRALGLDCSTLNQAALSAYLSLRYLPSPWTLYKHIKRLTPGSLLSWSPGRDAREEFFRCRTDAKAERYAGSQDSRFGTMLEDTVQRQLVADVPTGVLLSGGLDSAVIAATIKKLGHAPKCFTVGFSHAPDAVSEIEAAAETAKALQLPHYALRLTTDDLMAAIPRVFDHLEEPLGTVSTLAMWHLSRFAREEVTVALAGQGADEPLGGYRRHRVEVMRALVPDSCKTGLRLAENLLSPFAHGKARQWVKLIRSLGQTDFLSSYLEQRIALDAQDLAHLGCSTGPDLRNLLRIRLQQASSQPFDDIQKSLWLDTRTQLADDLLLYGDKLSMAHSLEVRVPFLDAELLDYVESLPAAVRVSTRTGKKLLRQYAHSLLPTAIIDRPKLGFEIPNLFRIGAFMQEARAICLQELGNQGLGFSMNAIEQLINSGPLGGAHQVRAWTLYSLGRWLMTSRGT